MAGKKTTENGHLFGLPYQKWPNAPVNLSSAHAKAIAVLVPVGRLALSALFYANANVQNEL